MAKEELRWGPIPFCNHGNRTDGLVQEPHAVWGVGVSPSETLCHKSINE